MASQTNTNIQDIKLYTIGWIAPLYFELAAALVMRTEVHGMPDNFTKRPNDQNQYEWGKIGKHYVVFASLPTIGIGAAAAAAKDMVASLPHLRCVLLVGIGGGVPRKNVRLGDVVVSTPDKTSGGVEQYDLGARQSDGDFVRKGHLNQPPGFVVSAVNALRALHQFQDPDVPQTIKDILERVKRMTLPYSHPGLEKDPLFVPSTKHVESEGEVHHAGLSPANPNIHYGVIASGNSVIKNAIARDKIVEDIGGDCLCFEMEAAGLMNNMPCLVIRGICEYTDSNKNDEWQKYAALTAAAYAKELLGKVDPVAVEMSNDMQKLLGDIKSGVGNLTSRSEQDYFNRILQWLSKDDQNSEHSGHIGRCLNGTCQWFFDSPEFSDWASGVNKTLFCPGIPGAGKTIVAAATIRHLQRQRSRVAFYYCSYTNQDTELPKSFIRAITRKVVQSLDDIPNDLRILYEKQVNKEPREEATIGEIRGVLFRVIPDAGPLYIVVDALDECTRSHSLKILGELKALQSTQDVRLLATSRPHEYITQNFSKDSSLRISARARDMECYLQQHRPCAQILEEKPGIWEAVSADIIERAADMFLLVHLYAESLQDAESEYDFKKFREYLKTTADRDPLAQAYKSSLSKVERLPKRQYDRAQMAIVWVAYAEEPLTSAAFRHGVGVAVAVEADADVGARYEDRLVPVERLIDHCAGLVTWNRDTDHVELVHLTTRDFFRNCNRPWVEPVRKAATTALLRYVRRFCPEDPDQDCNPQLLSYCIKHWAAHVSQDQVYHQSDALMILRDANLVAEVAERTRTYPNHISSNIRNDNYNYTYWKQPPPTAYVWAYSGLDKLFPCLLESKHIFPTTIDQYLSYPSILCLASSRGHGDTMKVLIEYGKSKSLPKRRLKEALGLALHGASLRGEPLALAVLLEHGADASRKALSEAAEVESWTIFKLLWDNFAENSDLGLALESAVLHREQKMVRLLLGSSAVFNLDSALNVAIDTGSEEMVKLLLEKGATVTAPALSRPSGTGNLGMVRLLVSNDVKLVLDKESVALHAAALNGHIDVITTLLDNGADIDKTSGGILAGLYGTPLYHAQVGWVYNLEAIRLLRTRGADDTIPGRFYRQGGDLFYENIRCSMDFESCRRLLVLKFKLLYEVEQTALDLLRDLPIEHARATFDTLMEKTDGITKYRPSLENPESLETETLELMHEVEQAATDLLRECHTKYTPQSLDAFAVLMGNTVERYEHEGTVESGEAILWKLEVVIMRDTVMDKTSQHRKRHREGDSGDGEQIQWSIERIYFGGELTGSN
ncbi:hypothetical protein PG997_005785 [Apiospora hydei]|uniref:Nucleoside phosphorylase domain-containing protein n=1 Tax=Apiospora hydei TaxID=1337664 RepID=A0ABR1WQY8_9PEZI